MRALLSKTWLSISALVLLAVGVTLALGWIFLSVQSARAAAADERVISVYDNGVETTFVTKASTVAEALDKAGFKLGQYDVAEPSLTAELVATNYHVNIYRARPVLVVDGGQRYHVVTAQQSAREIVQTAGEKIYPEDDVIMQRNSDVINNGLAVQNAVIDRATPIVLDLYGRVAPTRTQATTVSELLKEKNITLGEKDGVSLDNSVKITEGMKVRVWRDGKNTTTIEEVVKFPVRAVQDYDREVGYREIKTPGVNGKRMVTYEIVTKNGKEVSRKAIQSVVTEEPSEQVEIVGAKPGFSGDFAEALALLRQCESGGNYANKNNPLYRGAYQFSYETWANNGGYYDPADAPPALQDAAAHGLYMRRGWQPWPACSQKLGLADIYR